MKNPFQSRAEVVNHNKGLTGLVRGMFCALAAVIGCGGMEDGYTIPPGFGDDEIGAREYIKSVLDGYSYTYSEDENAQFRNLNDGTYFDNEYDVYATGPGGEEVYIEYDSQADGLTPEAAAGIESRTGTVPPLVRISPSDSEEEILQKLDSIL